ncbi:hypothetical protein [Litorimonas sp.]
MTVSLNFKALLAITLLSCVSCADAAQIDQDNQVTPEVTSDRKTNI